MPGPGEAVSVKQRRLMGLAEHNPSKVHKKNMTVLQMTKTQLHNFAATKEKGLPKKAPKKGPKK